MKPSELERVVIDTAVQQKAVMFTTDAKLLNRARERLVRLAKKLGVSLRQSYRRLGKLALIKHQRYAHAHQFKRANKSLRKLKTYLGRVIRDIERHIVGNEVLREAFVRPLFLARRVLEQERRHRGRKVYCLHAPEVECIGEGKAHRPYEFGVTVTVAPTVKHSAGGQFVTHAAALPGNPYDGHTSARSFRRWKRSSATCSIAASPMPAIAATTPRPITSSRSTRPARSAASRRRSSASSNGAPLSSRSSATSKNITAWAATTSPMPAVTPSTPCSPPPGTTSAACSPG